MAGTIEVRLHEKAMLTVKEAAAYSNIGFVFRNYVSSLTVLL